MAVIAELDETVEKMKDEAQKKQLELIELGKAKGMSDVEIDAEMEKIDNSLDEELKQLEKTRNKNLFIANRIQDYYRHSDELTNLDKNSSGALLANENNFSKGALYEIKYTLDSNNNYVFNYSQPTS